MSHLVRWHSTHAAKGLDVVLVDHGRKDTRAALDGWVTRAAMTFPVCWDVRGDAARRYGVTSWPRLVLVGTDGRVAWTGGVSDTARARLEEAIATQLAVIARCR